MSIDVNNISKVVRDALKPHGFRASGKQFIIDYPEIRHVAMIQNLTRKGDDTVLFRYIIYSFCDDIMRDFCSRRNKDFFEELPLIETDVIRLINKLENGLFRLDQWDRENIEKEIIRQTNDAVIPYAKEVTSKSALICFLEQHPYLSSFRKELILWAIPFWKDPSTPPTAPPVMTMPSERISEKSINDT